MGILLFAHVTVSLALVLFTVGNVASSTARRHQKWRKLQIGSAVGSFASGLALAVFGASITHVCLSGALLIAVVAGIELYAQGVQRPFVGADPINRSERRK